jgi:shikimate kinase
LPAKKAKDMRRIFLIGYMGAGKTTYGKKFAVQTGLSFIDLDQHIEARYSRTVRQIFAEQGEAAFRKIEGKMLREVAGFENIVIATGGGTPCFDDNMAFMNGVGTTVYLKVRADELMRRTEVHRHTRPVLQNRSGEELKQFIAASLEERSRFYEQAAIVIDTGAGFCEGGTKCVVEQLKCLLSSPKM